MTIELVDGKAGTMHISSEDKAIIHQAKFSKSDVVYDWGDAFKCSMSSSNRATIGTGCASLQGLDWHITAAESVTISNGSQGMKRNDIICAHYHRDSKTGNELVELVVLKGSPNATAAADPKVPSGKILSGAVDAYMPLWRIPLDDITVGTPVRLFTPRGALWDSVNQIHPVGSAVFLVSGQTPKSVGLPGTWVKTDWAIADKDRLVFDIENAQTSKNGANIRIYGWNDGAGQKFWFFTKQFGDVNMWIRTA